MATAAAQQSFGCMLDTFLSVEAFLSIEGFLLIGAEDASLIRALDKFGNGIDDVCCLKM